MIGRSEQALQASRKIAELVPEPMLREPGMTFLQHHMTRHLQMLVRFQRWDELLAVPAPPVDLPHARGMWHYARGRALVAQGDTNAAREELTALRAIHRTRAWLSYEWSSTVPGGAGYRHSGAGWPDRGARR